MQIKVNNRWYKMVYSWKDMTLQRFCDLAAIPMPKGYENYIAADGNYSEETKEKFFEQAAKITDQQLNEEFPAYYRDVIKCLTNIPENIIRNMPDEWVNDTYEYYFSPFVKSLIYHAPVIHFMGTLQSYQPESFKSFRVGLHRYFLPQTVTIDGHEIPLGKEPLVSYVEASDFFRGMKVSKDDVNRLALFMAIYCRRKGEKYSQERVMKRKDLFMKVPMSVVWTVFFYTLRRLSSSRIAIQLFGRLPRQIKEITAWVRELKTLEQGESLTSSQAEM